MSEKKQVRTAFDFMGRRRWWYFLSALVIVPGLISLALQGLNLGIDFTGGTLMQLEFQQAVTESQVRGVLEAHGIPQATLQSSGETGIIIRSPELDTGERAAVMESLEKQVGSFEVMRTENVGAVISEELRDAALWALALASVLMVAYITLRFQFRFAVAAVLAVLHDVFLVVGIFSLLRIPVDSSLVAALLTIIGYSINDTIVFFDRIRENLKEHRKGSVAPLVNQSIRQTLVRAINTSLTTLAAVAALLFLGGETTRIFALALFMGILSGTYSSIFTASSLWVSWEDSGKGYAAPEST